ncbi:hypothetical protein HDU96_004827 [Phlyctochytrium bullatum]|nr:hypothetical protein HDU96_004827 [Phlyctochytrium bullatum]
MFAPVTGETRVQFPDWELVLRHMTSIGGLVVKLTVAIARARRGARRMVGLVLKDYFYSYSVSDSTLKWQRAVDGQTPTFCPSSKLLPPGFDTADLAVYDWLVLIARPGTTCDLRNLVCKDVTTTGIRRSGKRFFVFTSTISSTCAYMWCGMTSNELDPSRVNGTCGDFSWDQRWEWCTANVVDSSKDDTNKDGTPDPAEGSSGRSGSSSSSSSSLSIAGLPSWASSLIGLVVLAAIIRGIAACIAKKRRENLRAAEAQQQQQMRYSMGGAPPPQPMPSVLPMGAPPMAAPPMQAPPPMSTPPFGSPPRQQMPTFANVPPPYRKDPQSPTSPASPQQPTYYYQPQQYHQYGQLQQGQPGTNSAAGGWFFLRPMKTTCKIEEH